ncbi:hypothetical protein ACSBR1_038048 [Camellia fascicularis]
MHISWSWKESKQTHPLSPPLLSSPLFLSLHSKLGERRSELDLLGELFCCWGGEEPRMVGIFSRFSVNRNIHRRTQSAIDEREVLPPNSEAPGAATVITGAALAAAHGIEVAVEFKPLEHPTEPLDNDRPILCPLPEPSILNDGRIWKERVSAGTGVRRRADLPVMQEGTPMESESVGPKPRGPSNRMILPSISAPEHNILQLLEECNASGI